MTGAAWADEARLAWRDPLVRWACVLIAALTFAALVSGVSFKEDRDRQAAAEIERSIDKRSADRMTLLQEARGEIPANPWGPSEPTRAEWNASRPSGPLAFLSFGTEDLAPLSGSVSLWMTRTDNLFRKYEFGGVLTGAAGRFDAGFLLILLLPLFSVALTYNVVAEERETGRLRLLLAQGVDIRSRFAARFALRLLPVFAALILIGLTGIALSAPPDRLALWTVVGLLYLILWSAVCVSIATLRLRAEAIATAGVAAWLLVAVIGPATAALVVQSASANSDRLELITSVRTAQSAANRRLQENLDGYVSDHPEFASGRGGDDFAAKLYVSQRVVERDIRSVLDGRAAALEEQARLADVLRFVSPASTAQHVLTASAGTDRARQATYEAQAAAFLRRWQNDLSPLIFRNVRLGPDDLARLPRFRFEEPELPRQGLFWSMLYLIALTALSVILAAGRLSKLDRG